MADIVFVHGMFQTAKSWAKWADRFTAAGHTCHTPSWPMHDGEPRALRANPPEGLGDLTLADVLASLEPVVAGLDKPVVIGHSVGGLIAQIFVDRGLLSAGVAVNSVAPNGMIDLDLDFIANGATIANPFKGNAPVEMNAATFHKAFANTLSAEQATAEFELGAVHDSRNVLRGCMGPDGKVDVAAPHAPLLLIAGEEDKITPADLNEKNFQAYTDENSVTAFSPFPGRSHYICNEPGWEEVADRALTFVEQYAGAGRYAEA